MCKVFTSEPIVVKGAFKFNLKEIAKNMANNGLIKSTWNSLGPDNGFTAMFDAIDYYRYYSNENKNRSKEEDEKYNRVMTSITDYNEIDCKVIWEIVGYLRQNH